MEHTETRTFAADRQGIAAIDSWIESLGPPWGESERTLFRARLCVAELAANVVEHGIRQTAEDHISVTLRLARDGIVIEFVDSRSPFDPTGKPDTVQPATIDAATPGGRGLRLVNAYASNFTYRRDGIYNRVTLLIAR